MSQDPFIEFLFELLDRVSGVHAKRMFGGHGIYRNGLMIGLVADDTLYLKVDDSSRPEFEARDLGPFVYEKSGKAFSMSYHLAPAEALEEPEQMELWAERAYAAAVREAEKKARKGGKTMSRGAKKTAARKTPAKKASKKSRAKTTAKKASQKSKAKSKKAAAKKRTVTKKAKKKASKKQAARTKSGSNLKKKAKKSKTARKVVRKAAKSARR